MTSGVFQRSDVVAFRPERVFVTAPSVGNDTKDWVIESIQPASFVNERLLASWFEDRRKAARKIRQQRRRFRRLFGDDKDETILRARKTLR